MVKAKAEPVNDVYCHACSQLADEATYHQPPACKSAEQPVKQPVEQPATSSAGSSPESAEELTSSAMASGDIICPLTGEIISPDDPGYIDALIDCYERVSAQDAKLYAAKQAIRQALTFCTEGDAKTRRVAGKRRLAKLEFPAESFDQSILKEAWNAYPQFRDDYLRIERIAPKLREVKKLVNTSGDDALRLFRDMVTGANRGVQGLPTIKVEK